MGVQNLILVCGIGKFQVVIVQNIHFLIWRIISMEASVVLLSAWH